MLTSTFCHGLPVSTPVLPPLNTSNLPTNLQSSPRPLPQPHAHGQGQRNMTVNSNSNAHAQNVDLLPVMPGGLKGGLGNAGNGNFNGNGSVNGNGGFDPSGPVIPPTSLKMKWSSMKSTLSPLGTPVLPSLAYGTNTNTNTSSQPHSILRPESFYAPSPSSISTPYSPVFPTSHLSSRSRSRTRSGSSSRP